MDSLHPLSLSKLHCILWCQVPSDSRPEIFSQLNPCGNSAYVISSLMCGWVCRCQLLLALGSVVILGPGSRGTHDHILLSQIRGSSKLERQVPVFISPGIRWPSYTPRHWVPFSSSSTTRRATVEVFEAASTLY
jgi:hypothetical protein